MLIIITAINPTGLDDTKLCDYEIDVRINSVVLWNGTVTGHMRGDGWTKLLRQIADVAENKRIEK